MTHAAQQAELVDAPLAQAGVTRIHAVTQMDWLGLPVHAAVRPNARSVTVEFGADLQSDEEAAAAAGWRARARFAAEYCTRMLRLETAAQLRREGRHVLDCSALPPALHARWSEARPVTWVLGRDLVTATEIEIPFELVHAADLSPPLSGPRYFGPIGSGLAAASSAAAATLAAFHEAIAVEAALAAFARDPSMRKGRRVAVSAINDGVFQHVAASIEHRGGVLQLWDVTERPGTVAVAASVVRRAEPHRSLRTAAPVATGSGDDHRSAAVAALLRLACSRMATLTGRGDIACPAGGWTVPVKRWDRPAASSRRASAPVVGWRSQPTTIDRHLAVSESRRASALDPRRAAAAGQALAVDLGGSGGAAVRVLLLPLPRRRDNRGG